MEKEGRIYVDLDNTLIDSVAYYRGNDGKRVVITLEGKERYGTIVRAEALTLLDFCRKIRPTLLLTAGMKDYALAINEKLNLGFKEQEVITREDWCYEETGGWGMGTYVPLKTKVDPKAILIDDIHPDEKISGQNAIWPRIKMEYLGIKEERFIKVRRFTG